MQSEGNDLSWSRRGDHTGFFSWGQDNLAERHFQKHQPRSHRSHGFIWLCNGNTIDCKSFTVSLNIHEDLTNMVVDWLGTSATFLDTKRRAAHSGGAGT